MTKKRGGGEGSIFKDQSGKWRGVITVGINANGSQKKKTFYGKTRSEVADKVSRALTDLSNHRCIDSPKMTLSQWLYRWLETYAAQELRQSTYISYETFIRGHILPLLGEIPLAKLTAQRLQEFYNYKAKEGHLDGKGGLDPKTIRNLHNMLHKALEQAVKLDLLFKNPCNATVLPKKQKQEVKYLTVDEQKRLQDAIKGERLGIGILIDLFTGLRLGELLGLTWENVNLKTRKIKVVQTVNRLKTFSSDSALSTKIVIGAPKTEKSKRTVPIMEEILDVLAQHKASQEIEKKHAFGIYHNQGFLLCNEIGEPLDPKILSRFFQTNAKKGWYSGY